ncbi:MAG: hypothetical protein EOP06_19420 [Proteobacteria bacterium]|nr:MAG: hypothetical protein EOP06_19420 [Pseudomonadota bacterium]
MKNFAVLCFVSLFAMGAFAQSSDIPLPPPTGPGNGNPGTPQPPRNQPTQPPAQPPYEDPGYPGYPTPPPATPPAAPREMTYSMGAAQTNRSGQMEFYFTPRWDANGLVAVEIVGLENKINVNAVYVVYQAGTAPQLIPGLVGQVQAGESLQASVSPYYGPVSRVIVRASAVGVLRRTGTFQVNAIVPAAAPVN